MCSVDSGPVSFAPLSCLDLGSRWVSGDGDGVNVWMGWEERVENGIDSGEGGGGDEEVERWGCGGCRCQAGGFCDLGGAWKLLVPDQENCR
jgi:hypothetical protein